MGNDPHPKAVELANSLPVCTDLELEAKYAESDGEMSDEELRALDLISLCDIVITGCETGLKSFIVEGYKPDGDGISVPWATLRPEQGASNGSPVQPYKPVQLYARTVRQAVQDYIDTRLQAGMSEEEATKLVDGSYTDAAIADSILQFAIYGEEVFG